MPIASYEVVLLDEPVAVYNFHVEDFECYYVSGQRVLVHNNNECGKKETARDILAKSRRGRVNREFPGQWKDYTLKEIEKAAKGGSASARKALKLLKQNRFGKKDSRKKGGKNK